jgi:hypothetical protein
MRSWAAFHSGSRLRGTGACHHTKYSPWPEDSASEGAGTPSSLNRSSAFSSTASGSESRSSATL